MPGAYMSPLLPASPVTSRTIHCSPGSRPAAIGERTSGCADRRSYAPPSAAAIRGRPNRKAAKVGIEHPVHALAHQRRMQRRKSHMRVPSWPEAVGEAEEIDLVDGAEKLGDYTLNDLVLQSRHAERALPAIGFRDVDTPNRLWPVTARVDAGAEIPEVGLQVLLVRRHRHPIDPRTCQPLLSPERPFERRDVDMMQQASEPGLGGLLGRRVHPREVGRQGCPALCPDPGLHARDPPGLVPSLSASRSYVR